MRRSYSSTILLFACLAPATAGADGEPPPGLEDSTPISVLPVDPAPKGGLAQRCAVAKPCTISITFESFKNVDSPLLDRNAQFWFALNFGDLDHYYPNDNGFSPSYYDAIGVGDSTTVNRAVATHVVGCGESKTIPVYLFAGEVDGFFGNPNDTGSQYGSLTLQCPTVAQTITYQLDLTNPSGDHRHTVEIRIRLDVNGDACGPADTSQVSPSSCDIPVLLEKVQHTYDSPTDENDTTFSFTASAGGGPDVGFPSPPLEDYVMTKGYIQTIRGEVGRFRIPCGETRVIPVKIHAVEHDVFVNDEGDGEGTITLSCPMTPAQTSFRVGLYGNVSHDLREIVKATFSARDEGWSELNVNGYNWCCQDAKCPDPCPVMGSYDTANCLVATAAPGTAPFVLPGPYTTGLYTTPLNVNQCPIGNFDSMNCLVTTAPTEFTTAFAEGQGLYVKRCNAICLSACEWMGAYDGANCFVDTAPDGTSPFIDNNAFYYTALPGNLCPIGAWDGRNCFVAAIPPSAQPFILGQNFYVAACRP